MPEGDLFLLFVRPLNRAGIPYMIGGSVASIFYGEPRLTHAVDFVITLIRADIRRLIAAFLSPTSTCRRPSSSLKKRGVKEDIST